MGPLLLRPALLALRCFDGSLRGELIEDRVAIPAGDVRDGHTILVSAADASLRLGGRLEFTHTNCLSPGIGSRSWVDIDEMHSLNLFGSHFTGGGLAVHFEAPTGASFPFPFVTQ